MAEKYTLSAQITVSAYTVVEADSLEEAIEQAKDREAEWYSPQARPDQEAVWIVDDLDGEVQNIRDSD